MATHAPNTGLSTRAPAFPPSRAARIASVLLSRHSAREIGEAIEVLIDTLALLDPPDEDQPDFHPLSDGLPGDPGDAESIGDEQGDQAWPEWTSLRKHQRLGPLASPGHEDAEDDDPREDDDDDSAVDDRPCDDVSMDLEEDSLIVPEYGEDQTAGPINLAPKGAADRQIMKPHIERIRGSRCRKVGASYYGAAEYRLIDSAVEFVLPDGKRWRGSVL